MKTNYLISIVRLNNSIKREVVLNRTLEEVILYATCDFDPSMIGFHKRTIKNGVVLTKYSKHPEQKAQYRPQISWKRTKKIIIEAINVYN